jgi:Holliday junction resolvase
MKNLFNIQPKEKDITREIRSYLRIKRVFHWKNWGGPMSERGVPDILGVWKGRLLGIEIKTARGHLNEYQQAFIDRINLEGGLAFVARSVEDVMERLG